MDITMGMGMASRSEGGVGYDSSGWIETIGRQVG